MSNQEYPVKLIKKSVGLPTVASGCCGSNVTQEAENQCCSGQSAQVSSQHGSQESVDLQNDGSCCCG